jgi:hypothetical protein
MFVLIRGAARTISPTATIDNNITIIAKLHIIFASIAGHCSVRPLQVQERFTILQPTRNSCEIGRKLGMRIEIEREAKNGTQAKESPRLALFLSLAISTCGDK